MGCFAFDCAECGSHEQEGIVRGCVVRVDGAWVRGEYSEYGWVGCAREGQGDQEVQVWLEQFQSDYFESWGVAADALLGTAIYCLTLGAAACPRGCGSGMRCRQGRQSPLLQQSPLQRLPQLQLGRSHSERSPLRLISTRCRAHSRLALLGPLQRHRHQKRLLAAAAACSERLLPVRQT